MLLKMECFFLKVIQTITKSNRSRILLFLSITLFIFVISYRIGLFWDNVLFVSKLGNHLFENGIFNWFVPDAFDSGHPPTLGFLNAFAWKIFGRELWVSHLVMIPFVFGLLYQIFKLICFYTKSNIASFFGFILVLVDPTLSAQFLHVNPEIIQLFFLFLAINAILHNKYYLKIIALSFLSIISIRSMMLCGGVFLFEFLNNLYIQKRKFKEILNPKFILSYVISSVFGLSYLIIHYMQKGWFISHENSPWANNHQLISFNGLVRNIATLIHRYADFGRIFIFMFILYSLYKFKGKAFTKKTKQLALLAFTSVFVVIIISIFSTNSFGHRYFMASYIFLTIIAFHFITNLFNSNKVIYSILIIALISGNLWIYPRNIAQGWDASLAHLPYFNLRKQAISYLDNENISLDKTATFFPNASHLFYVDMYNDFRKFEDYNTKNQYIFYSNVYNLSDGAYINLDDNYTIIQKFEKARIHIYIYKRNEP